MLSLNFIKTTPIERGYYQYFLSLPLAETPVLVANSKCGSKTIRGFSMLAIINSVVLVGLEGHRVRVEVDISNGLPLCEIVG